METVNLTRIFRRAALIALPLALMACGTDSIVGVEPSDASLAKRSSDGAGKINWVPAGTYYDYDTQIFYYQASGLASNQTFSVTLTAWVTASYDCASAATGIVVAGAFEGVAETISGSYAGQADKKGQASGWFQLAPSGALRCSDGLQPANFTVLATRTLILESDPSQSR
ncbi:hypothetical protein BH23GEM2_BH23GEM2_15490 [soil metagenome]